MKSIKKFLHHVARGQQAEAKAMLAADKSLLTESGEFTDYSGRRFICSAYEYAYWAKDAHMCRMLAQVDGEGRSHLDEETKTILRERINAMEEIDPETRQARGLVYWQNGIEHRSAHFDLSPLIAALGCYADGYPSWAAIEDYRAMKAAWLAVGWAQRDVPAHVAQEYCRPDRSFERIPSFTEPTLPRGLSFFSYDTDRDEYWFPLAASRTSGLGLNFSLTRGLGRGANPRWIGPGGLGLEDSWRFLCDDVPAVTSLNVARTADLTLLRDCLNPSTASPGLAR